MKIICSEMTRISCRKHFMLYSIQYNSNLQYKFFTDYNLRCYLQNQLVIFCSILHFVVYFFQLRLLVLGIQGTLYKVISIINQFPIYSLYLWIADSAQIAGASIPYLSSLIFIDYLFGIILVRFIALRSDELDLTT